MVSTKQPDENNYRAFQLLPMTISYLKKMKRAYTVTNEKIKGYFKILSWDQKDLNKHSFKG